jgi:type II secretory ATPase GspE/PulE/Tfp pilus assembly ATPase PilB-like protein
MMHDTTLSLILAAQADSFVLVSFIKPILALAVLSVYLRVVSSKIEPDARMFHLNVTGWNGGFLGTACLSIVAVLMIPIFWIGLPVMIIILIAPLLIYWKIRNEAAPEERQFKLSTESLSARSEQRKARKIQRDATAVFYSPSRVEIPVPSAEDALRVVHIAAEDLLLPAIEARASRVEIAATSKGGSAVQIVDAVRYKRDPMTKELASAVIDYLKKASELDLEDRRKLQRGIFSVRTGEKTVALNISTSGSSQGLVMRLDLDRDSQMSREYSELGFIKQQLEVLNPMIEAENRNGIILIGIAPGQGLTSSLYGLLTSHDAYTTNIKTLERDVQRNIEGIDHVEFDGNNPKLDFGTHARSIIRRGPDILMVSDLQDASVAEVLASSKSNDLLNIIGVQTKNGVAGAITDWFRAVGDLKNAASPLKAVITCKLIRKLCPECKQAYTPAAEQLKKLGIPSGKQDQLFRASGRIQIKNKVEECPVCRGTGYFGTTGIYEVMPVDREGRKQLAKGDLKAAYVHARRTLRMPTIQEVAILKAREGITSIEEVARISAAPQQRAAKPAAASAPASA